MRKWNDDLLITVIRNNTSKKDLLTLSFTDIRDFELKYFEKSYYKESISNGRYKILREDLSYQVLKFIEKYDFVGDIHYLEYFNGENGLEEIKDVYYVIKENSSDSDLYNKNIEELTKSYYLCSLPDFLIMQLASEAAHKGFYIYLYSTAENKGPALETKITIVLTKDSERKRFSQTKTQIQTYKEGVYFELGRARLCKTPRGSLYRFVEEIINYLSY